MAQNVSNRSGPLWNHIMFTINLEEYENSLDKCLKDPKNVPLYIGPELTYMYTFFQVFSLLIEERVNILLINRMKSMLVNVNICIPTTICSKSFHKVVDVGH